MPALAADRDVFLRRFGHFLLTALLPSPGGLALHPDPQSPRFDVLFGPPKAGREGPGDKDWSFPGPLLRLEDIQSELQVSFSRLQRPQEQEVTLLGQLIRPSGQADLLVLHLLLETFERLAAAWLHLHRYPIQAPLREAAAQGVRSGGGAVPGWAGAGS